MTEDTRYAFRHTSSLARWITVLVAILVAAMLYLIGRGLGTGLSIQRDILHVYVDGDFSRAGTLGREITERIMRAYGFTSVFLLVSLPIMLGIVILRVIWLHRSYRNLDALGKTRERPGLKSPAGVPDFFTLLIQAPVLQPLYSQSIWKAFQKESLARVDEEPTHWTRLIWSGWCLSLGLLLMLGTCIYLVFLSPPGGLLDVFQVALGVMGIGWAYTIFRVVRHITAVQTRMAALLGRRRRGR
jgi:Na+(H+)/acetate symporter ActP